MRSMADTGPPLARLRPDSHHSGRSSTMADTSRCWPQASANWSRIPAERLACSAVTNPKWRLGNVGSDPRGNMPTSGARCRAGQRFRQPGAVPLGAALVGDHSRHADARLEAGETLDRRRQAAGRSVGVDHQQHRCAEPWAISAVLPSRPSGEAPSNRPITPSTSAMSASAVARANNSRDVLARSHPAVEVVAGPAGGHGQVSRIEEVGPDLEGLHAQSLPRPAAAPAPA